MPICTGDIPEAWADLISKDPCTLRGRWESVREKSGSLGKLMAALKFPWWKRRFMEYTKSETVIEFLPEDEVCQAGWDISRLDQTVLNITSFHAFNTIKTGKMFMDGRTTMITDADTGDWLCSAMYNNGRLYQTRVSQNGLGTLYDVRFIMNKTVADRLDFTQATPNVSREAVVSPEIEPSSLPAIEKLVQIVRLTLIYPGKESRTVVHRYNIPRNTSDLSDINIDSMSPLDGEKAQPTA